MTNLLVLLTLMTINTFAQNQSEQDKMLQEFMKSRKKMIERLSKSFDEDFFGDDFKAGSLFDQFDNMLKSDISPSDGQGFKMSEKEVNGEIILTITPDENANVEVENSGNAIKIQSTVTHKTKNSQSSRSFSRIVSAPFGYEVRGPKNQGKDIIITMTPKNGAVIESEHQGKSQGQSLELIEKEPIEKPKGEDII
jgi:hypothetical protein